MAAHPGTRLSRGNADHGSNEAESQALPRSLSEVAAGAGDTEGPEVDHGPRPSKITCPTTALAARGRGGALSTCTGPSAPLGTLRWAGLRPCTLRGLYLGCSAHRA